MTKTLNIQLGIAASLLASLLVAWHPIVNTFALSLHKDAYTYILLVLPVFAAMLYLDRQAIRTVAVRNIPVGSTFLAVAIATTIFTHISYAAVLSADVLLSISMLALAVWWIGTFVFWFGIHASRLAWFPLCFLFGIVPLPQIWLDAIVSSLQYTSASAAHMLFAVVGIPVFQSGNILIIPGLTIQVAQECSSIRSTSTLILTTVVLAHLLLRSPLWKIIVVVAAIPLSIAKNGLRIWTIAMLGTRVDPGYLTGGFHHHGGVLFFAIALLVIAALLWLGRRWEGNRQFGKPHGRPALTN